jgi:hypothetical protein
MANMKPLYEIVYFSLSLQQKNILRNSNLPIINDIEWRILREIFKKFFNRRITIHQQNIINIIKWCNKYYKGENRLYNSLDFASRKGWLQVVIYLHEEFEAPYSNWSIDYAAYNGHLSVVIYLYEVVGSPFSGWTIDWASRHNRIKVMEFLDKNDKGERIFGLWSSKK